MANTIRIKRSSTSNVPITLANAELAFSELSKILYIGVGTSGANSATIEAIGGLGAFVSLGSTAQTIEGVKTFSGAIVLGTPGSGTLTNCTGLPVNTGVSGLGTGVATFLETPSSANLASAVTGGTGSGALVFATSPTLVTPALGTPSALVGTNISGTGANFTAGAVTNAGLTGEVTTSGLAATISNSAVIGKVITGYTSGAGVVAATDTILQAIQKLNGNAIVGVADAGALTGATLASNVLASSLTSVGTLSALTVTATIVGSINGNAATATTATNVTTNANLTGAITSVGNTTSLGQFTAQELFDALGIKTGTSKPVFDTSPTLITPTIGAATATSVNKVTITAPATGSTLTVAEGKTLTASNTLTFTGTDASSVAFGAGGTVFYTSGLGTGVATFLGTPSSANLASAVTGGTGTGALVFATSPTLVTPALGTPSALVGTNISGTGASFTAGTVTTNANLTGHITSTGNATVLGTASFSSANLAGALTDKTGTGVAVFATSPTLVSPALGTPTALVGTNISGTGLSFTAGTATNATNVAITSDNTSNVYFIPFVTAASGNNALKADAGTGANGLTYVPSSATLTTGIITANTAVAANTINNIQGNLTIAPYTGNLIIAPVYEDPVGGTSPSITVSYLDEALGLVTIAGGDLYLSTKTNAASAITPVNIIFEGATANAYDTTLTVTDPTANRTITLPNATGTVALTTDLSQFAATSSAQLATLISDETGSGALVFATSPTLVTPALGTPSALVGTNISGTGASFTAGNVTTNANLTGHITSTGNAAVLGSFTSSQLATALTDETGSGAAVFATSPTLVSPALGTPTALVGTNISGTGASFTAGNVTTNANLTGHIISVGNATVLGSFTAAQLSAALDEKTGSSKPVFDTSPTLITPTLGAATATSINKVTITAPATGSTLTIAEGKTLTASNTLTFTGTDASSVAFGAGGTVVYTSGLGTNVAAFLATPSSANLASAVTGETGTGSLVFSADPTFTGTLNCAALTSTGNVTVGGDLLVNGTTTTVNSTVTTLDDPIITLGGDGNGIDDDKDRGVEFKWNNGTAKVGFFGFDESTGYFTFIPQATNSSEVFTGTKGDIQATNFRGALIGNADTVTTNANLTGAITSVGNTTSLGQFTAQELFDALGIKTGTSKPVFDTSPTLITPTIGAATATSINKVTITAPATGSTLTIAEGKTLTASNTLTFTGTDASSVAFGTGGTVVYTSGLGTNVATFLATPSSANLAGALTDETGTGSVVFATSPTLVTPALGTPASGILTNCTGTASGLTAGLVTDGLYTTSSIDGGSY